MLPTVQVMTDIAKWLVPILGRGPGLGYTESVPPDLLATKLSLLHHLLAVMQVSPSHGSNRDELHYIQQVTEAGLSKLRAKFQFEQVDTEVHLAAPRLHRQLTRAGAAAASHKHPPHSGSRTYLSSGQTTDCHPFGGSSI